MTTLHAAVPVSSGAHDELVEQLDAHVREVVRREGVDPQRDAVVVRRIAESVVRDHDERSLTGVVAAVPDADAVVGELVARVSGFGPLQPFLHVPAVEEVCTLRVSRRLDPERTASRRLNDLCIRYDIANNPNFGSNYNRKEQFSAAIEALFKF